MAQCVQELADLMKGAALRSAIIFPEPLKTETPAYPKRLIVVGQPIRLISAHTIA